MKNIYHAGLSVLLFLFVSGCSKDFLKSYDDRIEGSWDLTDVDRVGIGGNTANLPFTSGSFTFEATGTLLFTDVSGSFYKGSWDIRKDWVPGNCVTDNDGNTNCSGSEVKMLDITLVDFASQDIRSEHFDEIKFTSTNRFKAWVYSGLHSYVFYFQRN